MRRLRCADAQAFEPNARFRPPGAVIYHRRRYDQRLGFTNLVADLHIDAEAGDYRPRADVGESLSVLSALSDASLVNGTIMGTRRLYFR